MIADLAADRDIRQHLWSLPTKEDLEHFTSWIERAFKQDTEQLKTDTTELGHRLETLEQKFDDAVPDISMLRDQSYAHDQKIEALLCQLDDFKNRSRRAKIRIRDLLEATAPKDIISMLQGAFREILNLPALAPTEIDRAHRVLRPPDDPDNLRDIICKFHKYTLKESIMQKMTHLSFYQDLSRCTLTQHRALRP